MDALLLGLNEVATLNVIMAIVIGALIGVTIGSIPGLEPAGVMAILLPITFAMEPLPGVSLLLGVYGGAWYGGAIPAILMNTPGTPVAVLTTYDGYPMAQKGEARRALSIAYTSSFIGGLISVFSLILLAPTLSQIARKFGSAEFAMLAALGMIFVVLAHRKHVVEAAMMLGSGDFPGQHRSGPVLQHSGVHLWAKLAAFRHSIGAGSDRSVRHVSGVHPAVPAWQ